MKCLKREKKVDFLGRKKVQVIYKQKTKWKGNNLVDLVQLRLQ